MFSDIVLLGINLSEGESMRVICPVCRGGDSAEQSLSITRNEGLVWQCFRAKCGIAGATNGAAFSKDIALPTKRAKKQWDGITHELPCEVAKRISSLWGIDDPPYWYWTTDYGGRVAMSIRSPRDTHRGWQLRALRSNVPVKALTYTNEGEEALSWYKTQPGAPTIIVEDIPSAVRASKYVNSVALLGTGVGAVRALEISEHTTNGVIIALDQDATGLSFRWARKWSLLWGDVKVLPLKVDIKNMNEQELKELLNESRTTHTSKYNEVEGGL